MTHLMERVAGDDRTVWDCTCGKYLHPNILTAATMYDEHLEHDVSADPLQELALIEAKQRHPSQRGLT